jgi:hypothetical protein
MKRRNRKSAIEAFVALSDAEKEKFTAEFDKEFIMDTFGPLNATERRIWNRAKKKLGRPVKGKGHKVISVSLEKGLLQRADAFAKQKKITRAALIASSLETILAKAS